MMFTRVHFVSVPAGSITCFPFVFLALIKMQMNIISNRAATNGKTIMMAVRDDLLLLGPAKESEIFSDQSILESGYILSDM